MSKFSQCRCCCFWPGLRSVTATWERKLRGNSKIQRKIQGRFFGNYHLDSWLKILWEATFDSLAKLSAIFIDSVTCCPIDKLSLSYFDVNGSSLDASHRIQAGFSFSKWTKGKLSKRGQKVSNSFGGRWHWLSCRSGASLIKLQQVTTSTWHTLTSFDNTRLQM